MEAAKQQRNKGDMLTTTAEELARLEKRMNVLANRRQAILARARVQNRKDRTRRAIVLGHLVAARAETDPAARKLVEDVLRKGVEERQRYLFPAIWPEAVRPRGRKNAPREDSDGSEE